MALPPIVRSRPDKTGSILTLFAIVLLTAFLFPLSTASAGEKRNSAVSAFDIAAERWPEAEVVFHSDPRWLGGDGATSVNLDHGRILWLFGDSFVDLSGTGSRGASSLVRNTIAVQTGNDPTTATMDFAWNMKAGRPAAFFGNNADSEAWYWPASGILLDGRLLVFLMKIRGAENDLGFEPFGWKAVWIDNPQARPEDWRLTWLVSPRKQGLVVGVGNPVRENGFLHVFAADGRDHAVYLARWPEAAARSGTLTAPRWWAGEKSGWVSFSTRRKRLTPIFTDGQMEFSVTGQWLAPRYCRIQTKSFVNPCLAVSTAPALTGPWTDAVCFFAPPEQGDPNLLIYAGKAHAALTGAERVFSYVVNTTSTKRLLTDMTIYYPVLLKSEILMNQTNILMHNGQ